MNAAQLLENSLNPDASVREGATAQLETAARENFPGYLHTLAAELANESTAIHIRRAAGLAFKNALSARDHVNQAFLSERYLSLPDDATSPLKQSLLSTLGSPSVPAGGVAAQCVAAVAHVELTAGKWPELIQTLLEFVGNQENTGLRINTLQAIGFICETIQPAILAARSNEILTAVVQGARKEEPSLEVQAAAIHSLYNSLEFIRDNFDREGERNYIMQVICEATQSGSSVVQVGAFECLVRIMGLYYEKMDFYMERALFGLTIMGMKHSDEAVALQAIEFWSTVCDEEIDLTMEAAEAVEYGETPEFESKGFAKAAMNEITPVLLQLLTTQEEDEDEDEWTKAMAAGSCLELFARNVGDAIVPSVVPFVESNIQQGDWHAREAAVMAFGAILDGPEPSVLSPLVSQALGTLIQMLTTDQNAQVRETVAWTLSRITDFMLETVDPANHLDQLVQALIEGLAQSPRIANNCCSALGNLVSQLANPPDALLDGDLVSSPMSKYYAYALKALVPLSEKPNNENNSRTAAYQTISLFITSSAQDTLGVVEEMFTSVLGRQEALMGVHSQLVGMDDRSNWNDIQINLCVVIASVIHKSPSMVAPFADRIMTNLLQLIQVSGKHSGVLEDAFAAVGAMANALEAGFTKYLEALSPFLLTALSSFEDWQVGQAAVYLVSDLARAVAGGLVPIAERIMVGLIEILRSSVIHRSVKPSAITAIGELALAIGPAFGAYLETTMEILSQAGGTTAHPDDLVMIEFVWSMREAIVDAFIGILNGVRDQPGPFQGYVGPIMSFLHTCFSQADRTDTFASSALGLIGDFADTYKSAVKNEMNQPWIQDAISYGRERTASKSAKNNAVYAQKALRSIQ